MNLMGIGPMEMGIIAIVALLVFGPGKLPEVMGQAGKMVRDFRKMSAELTGEFEKTIAEAKDVTSGISKELTGMSKEVNAVTNSVKKDLNVSKTKTVNSSRSSKPAASAAKTTTTSKVTRTASATRPSLSKSTTATASAEKPKTPAKSTSAPAAVKPKPAPAKAAIPTASREDPVADLSLFEPEIVERPRRNRRATPAIASDPTPRIQTLDVFGADDSSSTSADGSPAGDDAISRARARRRNAGYGQRVAGQ